MRVCRKGFGTHGGRRPHVFLCLDHRRLAGDRLASDRALRRERRRSVVARRVLGWAVGLFFSAAHQISAADAPNVVKLTMRTPHAGFNRMVVQVTVCVPGSRNCTTIDDVMVDTGSTGLRLDASVVPSWLRLPPVLGPHRRPMAECLRFLADDAWGPLARADVLIGGLTASGLPIQIIETAAPEQPASCPRSEVAPTSNGTLGVGSHLTDCQGDCRQSKADPMYFECGTERCEPLDGLVAKAYRLPNPVTFFDGHDNGIVFDLPDVTGAGARESVGTLTFGVGSDDGDRFRSAAILRLDERGHFTIVYAGSAYPESYIDSGTETWIVPDVTLSRCPGMPWAFCVAPAATREAVAIGRDGARTVLPFRVGDYRQIRHQGFGASGEIAVAARPQSSAFVWGAPFFIGRRIAVVLEGRRVPGNTNLDGPFYAIEARPPASP